ncbi:hypothetical protein [Vibrio parahaemolyticus]|uniref:hypothetical protein n=1 Tax=Vibrio parahaemolyticus TaxID=670 RepID=UPI00111FB33A|nr:hypothetical protein [Vibrio parahaemolyticus]
MTDNGFSSRIYFALPIEYRTEKVKKRIMRHLISINAHKSKGITEPAMERYVMEVIKAASLELRSEPNCMETTTEQKDDEIYERVVDDVIKLIRLLAIKNC